MTRPSALEDLDWPEDAQNIIAAWSASGMTFTADDLRKSLRPAPHSNMVGAAFLTAKNHGLIRAVGYTISGSTSRKHGVLREWQGIQRRTHSNDYGLPYGFPLAA